MSLLYVAPGQTTEQDVLANTAGASDADTWHHGVLVASRRAASQVHRRMRHSRRHLAAIETSQAWPHGNTWAAWIAVVVMGRVCSCGPTHCASSVCIVLPHFSYWRVASAAACVGAAFQCATLMPTRESDPTCTAKKRLLGNNFVHIVYDDTIGVRGYRCRCVRTHAHAIAYDAM